MTIAAGFKFNGGIILCADSEFTSGNIKTFGKKIFIRYCKKPAVTLGFAIAGSVPNAQKAIRKISGKVNSLSLSATFESINDAIEEVLEKMYREDIRTHPEYGKENSPDFDLIIAGWTPAEGAKLFATSEDCCNEVEDFELVGIGEYLARYLIKDIYQPTMDLMDIVTLATEALLQTKDNVPGCGGSSEFAALLNIANGTFGRVVDFNISNIERFSQPFRLGLHEILFAVQNLKFDEEKVRSKFRSFEAILSTVREEQKRTRDARQALLDGLSTPSEELPKP